jgi:hypothetical protein
LDSEVRRGGDNYEYLDESVPRKTHKIQEKVMDKKSWDAISLKITSAKRVSFLPISGRWNVPCLEKRRASVSGRRRTARLTRHSNTYKGSHNLPIVNSDVNLSC